MIRSDFFDANREREHAIAEANEKICLTETVGRLQSRDRSDNQPLKSPYENPKKISQNKNVQIKES